MHRGPRGWKSHGASHFRVSSFSACIQGQACAMNQILPCTVAWLAELIYQRCVISPGAARGFFCLPCPEALIAVGFSCPLASLLFLTNQLFLKSHWFLSSAPTLRQSDFLSLPRAGSWKGWGKAWPRFSYVFFYSMFLESVDC